LNPGRVVRSSHPSNPPGALSRIIHQTHTYTLATTHLFTTIPAFNHRTHPHQG
jgi:hypothetical protein